MAKSKKNSNDVYSVVAGKENANVSGVILSNATQEQLKHFYRIGHPYIIKNENAKEVDDEPIIKIPTIE